MPALNISSSRLLMSVLQTNIRIGAVLQVLLLKSIVQKIDLLYKLADSIGPLATKDSIERAKASVLVVYILDSRGSLVNKLFTR